MPVIEDIIFPPSPEIYVGDLNAEGGVVDGENPYYEYSPRSITPNGTKTEFFSITILNDGDAPATNFSIKFGWEPHSDWLNYGNTEIFNLGYSNSCPQKDNECTFEIITKDTGPINLQYKATLDHKLYQEIKNQEPRIIFTYYHDSAEKKQVFLNINMR